MEFDYRKLEGRIVEKFGTREAFARALGKSVVIVSKKLNNRSNFSRSAMLEWSSLLDISTDEMGMFFCTQKV